MGSFYSLILTFNSKARRDMMFLCAVCALISAHTAHSNAERDGAPTPSQTLTRARLNSLKILISTPKV